MNFQQAEKRRTKNLEQGEDTKVRNFERFEAHQTKEEKKQKLEMQ